MVRAELQAIAATGLSVVIGGAAGWAGSQGGVRFHGLPVFALGALLAFAINWIAFVPAWLGRTERHYDLTGSLTYLCVVLVALALGPTPQPRALLLGGLVIVWALRLGTFLFARVRRAGRDRRFDAIKTSVWRFLMAWSMQALWVLLTAGCALAAMTSARPQKLGVLTAIGTLTWAAGFGIEATADLQKHRFRADVANAGRFIHSGLWAWSRHPNYFGEILLWVGIALIAFPALSGWQYATLVSPVFVYILLTRVSGIPLLEAGADQRWADDPEYQAYRARTPVLFPAPAAVVVTTVRQGLGSGAAEAAIRVYWEARGAHETQGTRERRDEPVQAVTLDLGLERGGGYRLLWRLHADLPHVPLVTGWVDRGQVLPLAEQACARLAAAQQKEGSGQPPPGRASARRGPGR